MLSLRDVERALDYIRPDLRDIVLELRNLVAEVAPGVDEKLYGDGMAYYYGARGGTVSGGVCMVHILPDHIRLAFPHGAFLPDPRGLLEGAPRYKQYIRIDRFEDAPWEYLREMMAASERFDPASLALHPSHLPVPARRDLICFYRMGIVTGLAEPGEVIAWADGEIMADPNVEYGIIELSLSGRVPHSQLLYLLTRLQDLPVYDPALGMILARARKRLAGDPSCAADLVANLRLLAVEEKLPKEVKAGLHGLDEALYEYRNERMSAERLHDETAGFLEHYAVYTVLLSRHLPRGW